MKVLIIGAGPAGVAVAETLRRHAPGAEIQMLTAEPYPPYSPPAMADHFTTGSQAHFWLGEDWADRKEVDYRSSVVVTSVVPEAREVHTLEGESLGYDKLVVASGSRLHAPLEGDDLPGVYNFKSLSAAESLVERARRGEAKGALIIGAGFIGVEIALLLRDLGLEVTQIEMMDQVMPRALDSATAEYVLRALESRGVEVRLGCKAVAFEGAERAERVLLESGETLEADLLIAATGVRPNVGFLEGSGVDVEWGVLVDERLRTSLPDIYAAGDVAETVDLLSGERYVHAIFPNAVEQGTVVGQILAGFEVRYPGAKRMNSLKHLGLPVMVLGMKEGEEVLRARYEGTLRTLYLREDRLVGFQLVGDITAAGVLGALVDRGEPLGLLKDRLLEPNFGQGTVAWEAMGVLSGG
jgi:NADPH-dependent 2,4-dienoyl-CoA reductase/sulfur reductase-like enzyme